MPPRTSPQSRPQQIDGSHLVPPTPRTYGGAAVEAAKIKEAVEDGAVQLDAVLEVRPGVLLGLLGGGVLEHLDVILAVKGRQLVVLGPARALQQLRD